MYNYSVKYNAFLNRFNEKLDITFSGLTQSSPNSITDAMKYAVLDGGKRVRPVLCYATAEMLGVCLDEIDNIALALEIIHSYSLVHDDLPAMDNDDYRRGKLSTHKKFGEANGILCGDALLNFAFEKALDKKVFSNNYILAVKTLFEYSGYNGMIAGQVLDLENEGKTFDEKVLYDIVINKTAKLITAPLLCASILADYKFYEELKQFGEYIGILFQITDDILDVEGTLESIGKTPNKDEKANKMTFVSLYGIDKAKDKAKNIYNKARKIISNIPNNQFLLDFTDKIYNRQS